MRCHHTGIFILAIKESALPIAEQKKKDQLWLGKLHPSFLFSSDSSPGKKKKKKKKNMF